MNTKKPIYHQDTKAPRKPKMSLFLRKVPFLSFLFNHLNFIFGMTFLASWRLGGENFFF